MSRMKACNLLNPEKIAIQHLNLFANIKSAQTRVIYRVYRKKVYSSKKVSKMEILLYSGNLQRIDSNNNAHATLASHGL